MNAAQVTNNILAQLRLLDPTASAEVGTPERKIIEAVSEVIAASQVDLSILNQQHDLNGMTGARLDAYLGNFGFGRQQSTHATGYVTFARTSAATEAITIPRGTQVKAQVDDSVFPDVFFVTTSTVVMAIGETEVDAPVQSSLPGSVGNVDANTVNAFAGLGGLPGISTVNNVEPITGGVDGENDTDLKLRFKNTLFRNMNGTYDQFLALAVSMAGVSKANVLGPISRYQEYVQVPYEDDGSQLTRVRSTEGVYSSGGYDPAGTNWPHKRTSTFSSIPYSKYAYQQQHFLTNGGLDPAYNDFYRHGVDYVFNAPPVTPASSPRAFDVTTNITKPNITFLRPTDAADGVTGDARFTAGSIHLFEHAYISQASRNDYDLGILNCVDVFVNGSNPTKRTSWEVVPHAGQALQDDDPGVWTYQNTGEVNFRRQLDGRAALVGNIIQPLYWQPVLTVPDTITISGNTYLRANYYNPDNGIYYNKYSSVTGNYWGKAHYAQVNEVNGVGYSIRARNGIEWFTSSTDAPGGLDNKLPGKLSADTLAASNYQGLYITDSDLDGVQFQALNYTYDKNISDLQAVIEKHKQVTTDVLVHAAKVRYFRPYLTIMYDPGATKAVVDAAIYEVLSNFFNNRYFGSAIQLSDILQVVHNVPGVDNVRWTADVTPTPLAWRVSGPFDVGEHVRPTDANDNGLVYRVTASDGNAGSTEPTWPTTIGTSVTLAGVTYQAVGIRYRIEEVTRSGDSLPSGNTYYYADYFIQDNELAAAPTVTAAVIVQRAQNTWQVV